MANRIVTVARAGGDRRADPVVMTITTERTDAAATCSSGRDPPDGPGLPDRKRQSAPSRWARQQRASPAGATPGPGPRPPAAARWPPAGPAGTARPPARRRRAPSDTTNGGTANTPRAKATTMAATMPATGPSIGSGRVGPDDEVAQVVGRHQQHQRHRRSDLLVADDHQRRRGQPHREAAAQREPGHGPDAVAAPMGRCSTDVASATRATTTQASPSEAVPSAAARGRARRAQPGHRPRWRPPRRGARPPRSATPAAPATTAITTARGHGPRAMATSSTTNQSRPSRIRGPSMS